MTPTPTPTTITAVFDLDFTLIDIDSAEAWLAFLAEQKLPNSVQAMKACQQIMLDYDGGNMDMAAYLQSWFSPINGMSVSDVSGLAQQFAEQVVAPKIFARGRERLNWHIQQGHKVLIVSASPAIIVNPIVRLFSITDAVGIETRLSGDCVTDKVIEPFSFKEGKVLAVNQWLSSLAPSPAPGVIDYAYSDSINDVPLLQMAKQSNCINPNARLAEFAKQQGWVISHW
ncbi:HAD-IB family hydrolase [Thalassomonas viridans]|uniref:HAD-IB family hydrolase n=1 Tax=Thalassomonas viridans TaxID=137584 RepID=A0AAE9ZGL8_9GAMM|nr:HAD-IB family hydrolase [Thalassomonas viridans]WDE09287.1 HAD-IB family hydrolase [Thalassomonas viridans]